MQPFLFIPPRFPYPVHFAPFSPLFISLMNWIICGQMETQFGWRMSLEEEGTALWDPWHSTLCLLYVSVYSMWKLISYPSFNEQQMKRRLWSAWIGWKWKSHVRLGKKVWMFGKIRFLKIRSKGNHSTQISIF